MENPLRLIKKTDIRFKFLSITLPYTNECLFHQTKFTEYVSIKRIKMKGKFTLNQKKKKKEFKKKRQPSNPKNKTLYATLWTALA